MTYVLWIVQVLLALLFQFTGGMKLILPIELTRFIEREERDFYQRARLDKQNMIPSFEWTGEAPYAVARARRRGCRRRPRRSKRRPVSSG